MIEDQVGVLRGMLGCSMKPREKSGRDLPRDIRVEPWMYEFVRSRHSQEEWDAFFAYVEAGPIKRLLINMAMVCLFSFDPGSRSRD